MIENVKEDDFRIMMLRTLRLVGILTLVLLPLVWWKLGWRSAALLAVGAAVSASGLWEWLRIMDVVTVAMQGGKNPRPVGLVLVRFFLRLGLALVALYVSLKYLDGSVYALAAGLGLGILALTYEALKQLKTWTV